MSTSIHYDIGISGNGPGVGTLAYKLALSGKKILLLNGVAAEECGETGCGTRRARAELSIDPGGMQPAGSSATALRR